MQTATLERNIDKNNIFINLISVKEDDSKMTKEEFYAMIDMELEGVRRKEYHNMYDIDDYFKQFGV